MLEEALRHLVTWLAPFVPFAAEEAWDDPALERQFELVRSLKGRFTAAVEPEQQAGRLKSLLEVEVRLALPEEAFLAVHGLDLATMFAVSSCVLVAAPELAVSVRPAAGEKCGRCWRVLEDVKTSKTALCPRCEETS